SFALGQEVLQDSRLCKNFINASQILTNLDLLLATFLMEILVSQRFSHFEREVRLLSELEMATLYLLDNDMYFNPMKNRTTFGGLTILEWLRGYSILQKCYSGESGVSSDAVVKIDPSEFDATLRRG